MVLSRGPQSHLQELLRGNVHLSFSPKDSSGKGGVYGEDPKKRFRVLDLTQTTRQLERTLTFLTSVAQRKNARFLVVAPTVQPTVRRVVQHFAMQIHAPFVDFQWVGGMISNRQKMSLARTYRRSRSTLGSFPDQWKDFDVVFLFNPQETPAAYEELRVLQVPMVCLSDVAQAPMAGDYAISGNVRSAQSTLVLCTLLSHAVLEGNVRGFFRSLATDTSFSVKPKIHGDFPTFSTAT